MRGIFYWIWITSLKLYIGLFLLFIHLYRNIIDIQCYLSFRYTMKWSNDIYIVGWSPQSIMIWNYYDIIEYIPYSRNCVIGLYHHALFVLEVCASLISFTYFPSSPPPSLWWPPVCSLCLWTCFCFGFFVHLFCFLDST